MKFVLKNLAGKRFGRLTVIKRVRPLCPTRWKCRCDCGKVKEVLANNLVQGTTKSCGCYRAEKVRQMASKKGMYRRDISRVEATLRFLECKYKSDAKKRSISWNLTREEFRSLIVLPCTYCSIPPYQVCGGYESSPWLEARIKYTGIDRVDSSVGYVLTNAVPCCGMCNRAKSGLALSDFELWVTRVYKHFNEIEDETTTASEFSCVSGSCEL